MDLYEGTIVIRINGTQKPIDVQVHAHNSWTAKAAIEAQYCASFISWWRGPTQIRLAKNTARYPNNKEMCLRQFI